MIIISDNSKERLKRIKEQLENINKDKKIIFQKLKSLEENYTLINSKLGFKEKFFFWLFWWRSLVSNLNMIENMIKENEERLKEITQKSSELQSIYKKALFEILELESLEFNIWNKFSLQINTLEQKLQKTNNAKSLQIIKDFNEFISNITSKWFSIQLANSPLRSILLDMWKRSKQLEIQLTTNPQWISPEMEISLNDFLKELDKIKIFIYWYIENIVSKLDNQL